MRSKADSHIQLFEAVIMGEHGVVLQAPLMAIDDGPLVRVFAAKERIVRVLVIESMDEWRQSEIMPHARRAAAWVSK